jgi:hypothetical protein
MGTLATVATEGAVAGGAIGCAIVIIYGPNLMSPQTFIYPPIPLWFARWVMAPTIIIIGLIFCGLAYTKGPNRRAFRLRDLFRRVSVRDSSKEQLLLEGLFCIAFGVLGFLRWFK